MEPNNQKTEFKKRLYKFVIKLIKFLEKLPKDQVTFVIVKQLIRSGTSILGNYIEAQYSSSKREFGSYLQISLRSTKESVMWLCLLRDTGKTAQEQVSWFLQELDEYSKIFTSSIKTVKRKRSEE